LGVTNIAVDSDGESYPANTVKSVRYRHRRLRTKLQKKGTKAAKRRLRKLAGKESRFANHVNHCISKRIVAKALGTARGIVLEDLKHIRSRITARKPQRAILHSWAFADLRRKIAYKAELRGVPVALVNPRYTSVTCPACGYCDKLNRASQSRFLCLACGLAGHADHIAAQNIAVLGGAACKPAILVNASLG
jgi:IS605 OrfB family transposase